MAHLWLQNANEAEARKCERLNRTQLAPASRVDAQIAIHVESGTTCRSSACFGPAKRPRNKGRRAIRGMRCVARSGGTSAGRQMAVILGRVTGVPPVRRGALRWTDSVCCRAQGRLLSFSVSLCGTLPNCGPPGKLGAKPAENPSGQWSGLAPSGPRMRGARRGW